MTRPTVQSLRPACQHPRPGARGTSGERPRGVEVDEPPRGQRHDEAQRKREGEGTRASDFVQGVSPGQLKGTVLKTDAAYVESIGTPPTPRTGPETPRTIRSATSDRSRYAASCWLVAGTPPWIEASYAWPPRYKRDTCDLRSRRVVIIG